MYLAAQRAGAAGGRVISLYDSRPRLGSTNPELTAYRWFRGRGVVPPVFVPGPGRAFLQVGLPDLPAAALAALLSAGPGGGVGLPPAAQLGEWARGVLRAAGVADLAAGHARDLFFWLATGVDATAAGVLLDRVSGDPRLGPPQIAAAAGALAAACPGLAAHLADDTLDWAAEVLGVPAGQLRGLAGYDGAAEARLRGRGGFLKRLVDSGLSEADGPATVHQRRSLLGRPLRQSDCYLAAPGTFAPDPTDHPPGYGEGERARWETLPARDVVLPTGKVLGRAG